MLQEVSSFHCMCVPVSSHVSDLHSALAGSFSSVFSSMVLCPTELVKCRMQALHEMKVTGRAAISCHRYMSSLPWEVGGCVYRQAEGLGPFWLGEQQPGCFPSAES